MIHSVEVHAYDAAPPCIVITADAGDQIARYEPASLGADQLLSEPVRVRPVAGHVDRPADVGQGPSAAVGSVVHGRSRFLSFRLRVPQARPPRGVGFRRKVSTLGISHQDTTLFRMKTFDEFKAVYSLPLPDLILRAAAVHRAKPTGRRGPGCKACSSACAQLAENSRMADEK